jgi:CDP-glucose 4,6-dehydratase
MGMKTFWKNRRVLVTGHTGFKGAWLSLWLRQLGAEVQGIALEPEVKPGLLEQFGLIDEIEHNIQDIRDAGALRKLMIRFAPEIVFHLAAQPLVRRSYREPVDTWNTNVFGTINVMECLRASSQPVVAVMVTTDKVYQNNEWAHAYREVDPVGGHDPYSSSKAATEIAVASWRSSFFGDGCQTAVATARAGNVIGGGDYAEDRIIPDIIRSLQNNQAIDVRNPNATRPWQHVLEPLSGYLSLAEKLHNAQSCKDVASLGMLCSAWNFGPLPESNQTVKSLVTTAMESWPGSWADKSDRTAPHEANFLSLAIDKAARLLAWYPRWSFDKTVRMTVDWYRKQLSENACPRALAIDQIEEFTCNSHH